MLIHRYIMIFAIYQYTQVVYRYIFSMHKQTISYTESGNISIRDDWFCCMGSYMAYRVV